MGYKRKSKYVQECPKMLVMWEVQVKPPTNQLLIWHFSNTEEEKRTEITVTCFSGPFKNSKGSTSFMKTTNYVIHRSNSSWLDTPLGTEKNSLEHATKIHGGHSELPESEHVSASKNDCIHDALMHL